MRVLLDECVDLSFQQNLPRFSIAVIVLRASSNRLVDLRPLIPKLLETIPKARTGQVTPVSL